MSEFEVFQEQEFDDKELGSFLSSLFQDCDDDDDESESNALASSSLESDSRDFTMPEPGVPSNPISPPVSQDSFYVTVTPCEIHCKERENVPTTLFLDLDVPIPIHQKYHNRVPECAIEKILCKSRIWLELVVIPIYIWYGFVLDPHLSTLTIKEFEANVAKGIVPSFIVALLQFPVANGRDRNDEGKLINYSLSFVQNDFGPTVGAAATLLLKSEAIMNTMSEEIEIKSPPIIFIDAVQEVQDKGWAKDANDDVLEMWNDIFTIIVKGFIAVLSDEKLLIEAKGGFSLSLNLNVCILYSLTLIPPPYPQYGFFMAKAPRI